MIKKRRTYQPRIVGGQVMMPADLERLHKYMLEIEGIDHISDEMRAVVESEWPELVHKLPPKKSHADRPKEKPRPQPKPIGYPPAANGCTRSATRRTPNVSCML
jgi:hypothetical protein